MTSSDANKGSSRGTSENIHAVDGEQTNGPGMAAATQCVHAGQWRGSNRGVVNPVDPSTAFHYIDDGPQYYPRYFNTPNQEAIVTKLCRLESAEAGMLFSSGMAAVSMALMGLLKRGDHVVIVEGIYGGTNHFILKEFDDAGIAYDFFDGSVAGMESVCRETTRMVYVESPTNPLMQVVDLAAIAAAAHQRSALAVIDNTFASPINQVPLRHGFDVVIHSGTKYLGGHSDLSFGAVLARSALMEQVHAKSIRYGGNLNAWTCYLVERSLKTLAIRVERQNVNALAMAKALSGHDCVSRVFYPGLPDFPGHAIAQAQMSGFGGMLAFELADGIAPRPFLESLNVITPAMSLGGVESTAVIPRYASHRLMPADQREALGITEQLIRVSAGIEDADDLCRDLTAALNACRTASRV